jgi:hypothetical protein
MKIETLARMWLEAKEQERHAQDARKEIESKLLTAIGRSDDDMSSENVNKGGFKIAITGRSTVRIDSETLQYLAAKADIEPYLSSLFRWKPEMDKKAWKESPESVKSALSDAITIKPGRPGFKITKIEKE